MALLKYQRNRLIIFSSVLLLGGVVFLMYTGVLPGIRKDNNIVGQTGPAPVVLNMWNVFEESDAYAGLISDYRVLYPHIAINYTKIDYFEYRDKLNKAFIAGNPPDIYAIHNTWLPLE